MAPQVWQFVTFDTQTKDTKLDLLTDRQLYSEFTLKFIGPCIILIVE